MKDARAFKGEGAVLLTSTREIALEAALKLPQEARIDEYIDKTYAEILIAEAELIETWLDRPDS